MDRKLRQPAGRPTAERARKDQKEIIQGVRRKALAQSRVSVRAIEPIVMMLEVVPESVDTTAERADRMHAAISATFEGFYSVMPDASFERRAGHSRLILPVVPLPLFNGVVVESKLCSGIVDSIREVEGFGVPCGAQLRDGWSPDAEAEVTRLGFTARRPMPGMAVAADGLANVSGTELSIARAGDAAALAEAARVAAAGFGTSVEAIQSLYSQAVLGLHGFAVYVGRIGVQAVTTGMGYALGREVAIFSVATPPEYRRRGYGGAITAHAARAGFEAGADLAWLQTSPLGEPVYRRLGFRHVVMHSLATRPA
jgi:ribosomal protein S18 acetylase RimI-like enzyme